MKNDTQEEQLIDFAKQALDESIKSLDPDTLSRLQSVRRTACSNASESYSFNSWVRPALAMATTCLLILTIALWDANPPDVSANLPFDDVGILASADGWEFYEDLEFYSWLAEHDQTG